MTRVEAIRMARADQTIVLGIEAKARGLMQSVPHYGPHAVDPDAAAQLRAELHDVVESAQTLAEALGHVIGQLEAAKPQRGRP